MKLDKEQVQTLNYGDNVEDENGNELYYHISQKIINVDTEKSSADVLVTIQDVKTGKKYKAELIQSEWYGEAEHNAEQEWEEVISKPKKPKPTKKIKLFLAATDGQDGSYTVSFFNTKKEALKDLDRTEDELEGGSFYDDGQIKELTLEIDNKGKLINKEFHISFGD
jgi:hypothetical protein